MYNPSSLNAEEFICHDEALASIAYASENRNNLGLVDSIIEKAERKKGLSHREASVLLACDVPERFRKSMRWLSGSSRISTATAS